MIVSNALQVMLGAHGHDVHGIRQNLGREANSKGCAQVVASEDPQFHTCLSQCLNGLAHILLELVLDRGKAQNLRPTLDFIGHLHQFLLAILNGRLCFLVAAEPLVNHFSVKNSAANNQAPQALAGVLVDALLPIQTQLHRCVSTFHEQEHVLVWIFNHNRHLLPGGVEGVKCQQTIALLNLSHPDDDMILSAVSEIPSEAHSSLHEGLFIWTFTLVAAFIVSHDSVGKGEALKELESLRSSLSCPSNRRIYTVVDAIDGNILELHDVLGQSACFVREDV
mmetsp:Transcript_47770/g.113502  ORF Transcript_47770/g.113502 Transcript_47770/m.113502 type:complete len:280 (-) Transcript_47770:71-910(-)